MRRMTTKNGIVNTVNEAIAAGEIVVGGDLPKYGESEVGKVLGVVDSEDSGEVELDWVEAGGGIKLYLHKITKQSTKLSYTFAQAGGFSYDSTPTPGSLYVISTKADSYGNTKAVYTDYKNVIKIFYDPSNLGNYTDVQVFSASAFVACRYASLTSSVLDEQLFTIPINTSTETETVTEIQ